MLLIITKKIHRTFLLATGGKCHRVGRVRPPLHTEVEPLGHSFQLIEMCCTKTGKQNRTWEVQKDQKQTLKNLRVIGIEW